MSKRSGQRQAARIVREHIAAEKRRQRTLWITISAVAVLVIAGLVGWGVWQSQKPAQEFAVPTGITNDGGDRSAIFVAGEGPVLVEVYQDFLCPACKQFETLSTPTLNQLIEQKKIKLVWHPLGFLDRLTTTNYSTRSASAAGCAADGGKLKAFGEALFAQQPPENSPGLSNDEIIAIGGSVGLDPASFGQCVRAEKYADWVGHVNDQAAQRGVNSTPTVFVAGKKLPNPTPQNLAAAVAAG